MLNSALSYDLADADPSFSSSLTPFAQAAQADAKIAPD
ncbi:hypothetical protein J699_01900 [Acinetobacter sp. 1000160]|nr:hypothetical protein ACINWC323_3775 [Acinetobacter sp. WC-323]EXB26659.1 hypothetical protein J537_1348 [Acinetobacter baumannii 1437282]EXB47808.1 hypothetical protein J522_1352 [Acinetobacter baumannii 146457]EYT19899.1 hypothetical protein J699_01900 [Acinetobacter sp. 1000160]